jgi:S-formylglutathione hydrolase
MRFGGVPAAAGAAHGAVPALWFLPGSPAPRRPSSSRPARSGSRPSWAWRWSRRHQPARGALPGDDDSWDFGLGAGFYVDATRRRGRAHYRMRSYVVDELPAARRREFPIDDRAGHLRPLDGRPRRADARAPNPGLPLGVGLRADRRADAVPVGREGLRRLPRRGPRGLGPPTTRPSCCSRGRFDGRLLVDQGLADKFLERELQARAARGGLRRHGAKRSSCAATPRYDHSYFFISTFVEDHLRHHARVLRG